VKCKSSHLSIFKLGFTIPSNGTVSVGPGTNGTIKIDPNVIKNLTTIVDYSKIPYLTNNPWFRAYLIGLFIFVTVVLYLLAIIF
jgi:hypothetical protein